jgi:hypothetical protein
MEPRDPTADPTPAGDPPPGELDLAAVGLAVFFLSLIAIVAALLIVPALT